MSLGVSWVCVQDWLNVYYTDVWEYGIGAEDGRGRSDCDHLLVYNQVLAHEKCIETYEQWYSSEYNDG